MNSTEILQNLVGSFPQIHGACVFDRAQGMVACLSGELASREELEAIALKVSQVLAINEYHFHDIAGLRICWTDRAVCVRPVGSHRLLLVLHTRDLVPEILTLPMGIALEAMRADEQGRPGLTVIQPAPAAAKASKFNAGSLLQGSGPLAEALATIRQEMVKAVGPMAFVIMDDALEQWAAGQPPAMESLPALLGLLEQEIEGKERLQRFRDKLAAFR